VTLTRDVHSWMRRSVGLLILSVYLSARAGSAFRACFFLFPAAPRAIAILTCSTRTSQQDAVHSVPITSKDALSSGRISLWTGWHLPISCLSLFIFRFSLFNSWFCGRAGALGGGGTIIPMVQEVFETTMECTRGHCFFWGGFGKGLI